MSLAKQRERTQYPWRLRTALAVPDRHVTERLVYRPLLDDKDPKSTRFHGACEVDLYVACCILKERQERGIAGAAHERLGVEVAGQPDTCPCESLLHRPRRVRRRSRRS